MAFAIRHRSPVQAAGEFRSSRDFPIPGSPAMPITCPCPPIACASRACRSASSRVRPTKRLRGRASRRGTPARRRRRPRIAYTSTGVEGISGVASRLALHLVLYQSVCGSADKDGIGRGLLLEPSRYMERVANRSVGQLWVVYRGRPPRAPCAVPGGPRRCAAAAKRVRRVQTLTQLKGRQHRPASMVLLRYRRPKQGQEALAGDLERVPP